MCQRNSEWLIFRKKIISLHSEFLNIIVSQWNAYRSVLIWHHSCQKERQIFFFFFIDFQPNCKIEPVIGPMASWRLDFPLTGLVRDYTSSTCTDRYFVSILFGLSSDCWLVLMMRSMEKELISLRRTTFKSRYRAVSGTGSRNPEWTREERWGAWRKIGKQSGGSEPSSMGLCG
jgi:hypothetical protein